jgi:DNA-binding NtrC family response regulator
MSAPPHHPPASTESSVVLILSPDAVAAALLGGLVETLGYTVQFARPPEAVLDSLRRIRPRICLVDCTDPTQCTPELIGRATMRGISVIIFGTREAIEKVRALASSQRLDWLLMPAEVEELKRKLEMATVA